jgi:hypothetical protein
MKQSYLTVSLISLFIVLTVAITFSSCKKKDDPAPSNNNNNTPTHYSGDTQGSVTIDGTTTTVSGSSTNSSYGLILTPRNMTPANSYPSFSMDFGTMPTKDSTYTISLSNFPGIAVGDANTSTDNYYGLSGSIVVKMNSDGFTATITNVSMQNQSSQTKVVSGSITYYK